MEQLQRRSLTRPSGSSTSNFTAPQWQEPLWTGLISIFALVGKSLCILFPVDSVEIDNIHGFWLSVEAPHIDVNTIGIGSGYIEGFYSTAPAEVMFGNASIKCICLIFIYTGDKLEFTGSYDEMQQS
jgi:hypothetical protein